MATRKKSRASKKVTVDFDDEESVLAEMARALDENAEDLKIDEDRGLSSFGEGTVYCVKSGREEYMVAENEEQAHALAIAIVTQDLEEEPESFTQSWLEGHIDTEQLRKELHSDVHSERYDYYEDLGSRKPDEFWEEAEREGMDKPDVETDEDGDELELREPTSSEVDTLADKSAEELLRDPMQYLSDIYGDDAVKEAIKIAGIDVKAAAEDAVDTDGAGHFLGHYDSATNDSPNGLVYWRTN